MAKEATNEPLQNALDFYRWTIDQPGHGVNSPQPRNLKLIIKAFFRKEGLDAVSEIEREALRNKPVRPAVLRPEQVAETKKNPGQARAERLARKASPDQPGEPGRIAAMQNRIQRLHNKGLLETPTLPPASEANGSAAAGKPNKEAAVKSEATESVQPLTATEVAKIVADGMSGKQVAKEFGADRVKATLEAFNDDTIVLTGSSTQLANRLISRLTA